MSNRLIYLVLLLLPSYLVRFKIFGLPSTLLEIIIYALALVWLADSLAKKDLKQRLRAVWWKLDNLTWPLTLFFLASVISVLTSSNPRISLGIFKGWYFDAFLFLIIFLDQIRTKRQVINSILALSLSGFIVSLYGLIEYFFGFGLDTDWRLNSVYPTANFVSLFTIPILLLSYYIFKNKNLAAKNCLNTSLFGFYLIIITVGLYFSKSYGGVLALAAGLIYLALKIKKHRPKIILSLILGGLIFLNLESGGAKFNNLLKIGTGSSTASRFQIWQTSLLMIDRQPILGVGLGNFEQAYVKTVPELFFPPLEWLVNKAHNLYLNLWLETGLLGLFSFLWLAWEFFQTKNRDLPLILSANAALVAILIHGLVDIPVFKNDLIILCLVIIATKVSHNTLTNYSQNLG